MDENTLEKMQTTLVFTDIIQRLDKIEAQQKLTLRLVEYLIRRGRPNSDQPSPHMEAALQAIETDAGLAAAQFLEGLMQQNQESETDGQPHPG